MGSVRDCFHDFFLLLTFQVLEVSHVKGSSLTTSLRYQDLLFFFCNQLGFERLVIRRTVEIATPWSVGLFVIIGTK